MPRTGAHNWPLVPSPAFPGEQCLACSKCKSTNVTMSIARGTFGTGPGGRWRMGDVGGQEFARCNACGNSSLSPTDPAKFPNERGTDAPHRSPILKPAVYKQITGSERHMDLRDENKT